MSLLWRGSLVHTQTTQTTQVNIVVDLLLKLYIFSSIGLFAFVLECTPEPMKSIFQYEKLHKRKCL